jgi:FKBP-type peptidyl-prolyl cis-trans isomerase FkpA
MRIPALLAVAIALPFTSAVGAEVQIESDEQKTIYALGAASAQNLAQFDFSPQEVDVLLAGLRDGLTGEELRVEIQPYLPQIRALAQERSQRVYQSELKNSAPFLAEAEKQKGATKTDSGIIYLETVKGEGDPPKATDTVTVHYRGTLRDGSVFDSSVDRGEPASFPLNGVIPCWTEALQLMRVGGKAAIYCPNELAYKDKGAGAIPAGAALRFDVELLAIE